MRDRPKPPFAGQRQDLPGGLMIDAGDPGPDVLAHVTTGGAIQNRTTGLAPMLAEPVT